MIRLFITLIFIALSLGASSGTESKIKKTSSNISAYSKNQEKINKKMSQNAKAILRQNKTILKQQRYLKKLKKELLAKEKNHKENKYLLKELKNSQSILKEDGDSLEEELVFTIAQSVSLSIILEEEYSANEESLIEFEVLKLMLKNAKIKIKKLNGRFYSNSQNIKLLKKKTNKLKKAIKNIDLKRKDLISKQIKNQKDLKKLKIAKASYKKELKRVLNKQDSLKKTLAKLNIIKIDEAKKAQEKADRVKAFNSKVILADKTLPKVKKHGSSYKKSKTKKYRGKKTIAPFSPYTITKKYGTYTDPIYGIKVFNESISLKPSKKNTKVKTVFNGKVIYAAESAVLDKIVIIEHSNGLHTIYANLSQISPNIKKGKKIKKGYAIGRVNDELIFEVTQKSYHINPIRLFQ
ncbi:MAG: peptidoglycan DD-metalloendopeptidase family protein [Sulfurimonas sp.]|nr:peptidoglycan DD-metalloendopeptidase family protein [Sulfurimonas sp.]